MKARFTVERIFANAIELELDDATVAIESKDCFDNIMRLAEAQYSDLVDAGKEPEIGDQIEVTLIPVCDHCGEEIVGENETPCFIDGRMVCESCYDLVSKHRQREYELEDVGINLDKIAEIIHRKMIAFNDIPGNPLVRSMLLCELETLIDVLNAMNIPISPNKSEGRFTSFTLNGKTYTL